MWKKFHYNPNGSIEIYHTHTHMGFFVASIWLNLDIIFVSLT
jgi:hypothetical protein